MHRVYPHTHSLIINVGFVIIGELDTEWPPVYEPHATIFFRGNFVERVIECAYESTDIIYLFLHFERESTGRVKLGEAYPIANFGRLRV